MIEPWKKIREEPRYDGYRKISRWTFMSPQNKEVDFDIIVAPFSACVLALTKDNNVVLAEQFRQGPQKVLKELPGGGINKGESPLDAIKRELLEETGYTGDFEFVGTDYRTASSDRISHNFVATNCYKLQEQNTEEDELIEVVEMPLKEFREYLRTGQMTDVSAAYLGLDYLGLLSNA